MATKKNIKIETPLNHMSLIYKALREEARRSCKAYREDIEYDIQNIKACVKDKNYNGVPRDTFVLGFRECGVDSSGFIHMRGNNYPYVSCFKLILGCNVATLEKISKADMVQLADKLEKPYDEWLEYKETRRNYGEEHMTYAEWWHEVWNVKNKDSIYT